MITDFVIQVFTYMATLLIYSSNISADGEPTSDAWFAPPDWVQGIGGPAAKVFELADSMSVWFPWAFLMGVFASVVASLLAGFGIRLVRMLISHFTGGGGSA